MTSRIKVSHRPAELTNTDLAEGLRRIADEMERGDWEEQECAVVISRDAEGMLTFCGWGCWGQLIDQAHRTKRPDA